MHPASRSPRVLPLVAAVLVAGCGEGSTGPRPQPGVRAVLGAGIADTIEAQPLQALVVEVRRPDGQLARGVVVRFEPQPPADSTRRNEPAVYVCGLAASICGGFGANSLLTSDTTDADGRAKVAVRLGRVAGRAVVRLIVPELGLADSATFTVTPGAAARVRAVVADTALDVGGTAVLRGRAFDRYGNVRAEAPTPAAGAGAAIAVDPGTGTVTAQDMGTQWLVFRQGSHADSMTVRVIPSGRLVVNSTSTRTVRLVNLNGSDTRTLVSGVASGLGVFPRFDATRQRVTLHSGLAHLGFGTPTNVMVVDTSGTVQRAVVFPSGLESIVATRQLADGTLLVVGRRLVDVSESLSQIAADNTVRSLVTLPGGGGIYGGADIAPDGSRVAYLAHTMTGIELRVVNVATGAVTVIEPNARAPRWSPQGDRLAYLAPLGNGFDGPLVVANADGTGRRALGGGIVSPGIAWSPDGRYLVTRTSAVFGGPTLRVMRVSDGASVLLRFRGPNGAEDYFEPDWR